MAKSKKPISSRKVETPSLLSLEARLKRGKEMLSWLGVLEMEGKKKRGRIRGDSDGFDELSEATKKKNRKFVIAETVQNTEGLSQDDAESDLFLALTLAQLDLAPHSEFSQAIRRGEIRLSKSQVRLFWKMSPNAIRDELKAMQAEML